MILSLVLTIALAFSISSGALAIDASSSQKAKVVSPSQIEKINGVVEIGDYAYSTPQNIADLGESSVSEVLLIDDVSFPLYPTFNDPDTALTEVNSQCSTVIDQLAAVYNLDDLSSSNWKLYRNDMLAYLNDSTKPSWYNEENKEFAKLYDFFDVYENNDENANIVSQVDSTSSVAQLLADDNFLCSLPHSLGYDFRDTIREKDQILAKEIETIITNSSTEKTNEEVQFKSCSIAKLLSYNTSNAIWYAKYYAYTSNPNYRNFASDCTNFASQILNYAGKPMDLTWYTTSLTTSSAWDNANSFINYWRSGSRGYVVTFAAHKGFSAYLTPGCFITYDASNDGDWDHVGFVTDTASSYSSSLGYTDYQVAQHTTNYLAWASSPTNGWDTIMSSHPSNVFGVLNVFA